MVYYLEEAGGALYAETSAIISIIMSQEDVPV